MPLASAALYYGLTDNGAGGWGYSADPDYLYNATTCEWEAV